MCISYANEYTKQEYAWELGECEWNGHLTDSM
jgi:hypothetical protein